MSVLTHMFSSSVMGGLICAGSHTCISWMLVCICMFTYLYFPAWSYLGVYVYDHKHVFPISVICSVRVRVKCSELGLLLGLESGSWLVLGLVLSG